jgi:hypothetical protein
MSNGLLCDGLDPVTAADTVWAVSSAKVFTKLTVSRGWSLFLGLSSLLAAPLFGGQRLEKLIRAFFIINGVCCLLGGIGYVFDLTTLVFLTIDLGMGGSVMAITAALCVFFRRMLGAR